MRDPRYDVLFEPVTIGPVVAKNRFFQVPHCNGMGYRDPSGEAYMRQVKAEGGWAVVCTEEVEIHPSADTGPTIQLRIWSDQDLPALARIAEKIHQGGALAGIELCHGGMAAANLITREAPLGPQSLPVNVGHGEPVQTRAMTKRDIAELRTWHRDAVVRSLQAGYDLVYVYAGHAMTILQNFLSPYYNNRSDEYGGSLKNRARLLREVLEDTCETGGGRAAVGCRIVADELLGGAGLSANEIADVIGMLGELPDLWDFQVGDWENDSATSRFSPEGAQEEYVRGLKALTTKPVVGVGRFTSPDLMVRQVTSGVLDFIGAARPSIADPFLPRKIERGDLEDIRECIGCNICVTGDWTSSPIRCTQNPTMGEEFRRGWHPERIAVRGSDAAVLVVGSGPAGLEAARALGQRGYAVSLAEATRHLGGRVRHEAALPGLAAWIRVVDYRTQQLGRLDNVEVFRESHMTAEDILGTFQHVVVATGATWRRDGVGRWHAHPISVAPGADVLTPDDIMTGARPAGRSVVLYDDDRFYLGAVLAELLAREDYEVTLVTPTPSVSQWTVNTMELVRIRRRIMEAGVRVVTDHAVTAVHEGHVVQECVFTHATAELRCDSTVLVTARLPNDVLCSDLAARGDEWAAAGLRSVTPIGDASAPSTIAAAVWSGHKVARELDDPNPTTALSWRREVTELAVEEA